MAKSSAGQGERVEGVLWHDYELPPPHFGVNKSRNSQRQARPVRSQKSIVGGILWCRWRGKGKGKGRGNERKLNLEISLEFNINYSPWQFAVRSSQFVFGLCKCCWPFARNRILISQDSRLSSLIECPTFSREHPLPPSSLGLLTFI